MAFWEMLQSIMGYGYPPPPPGVNKLTKWNYYLPVVLRTRAVISPLGIFTLTDCDTNIEPLYRYHWINRVFGSVKLVGRRYWSSMSRLTTLCQFIRVWILSGISIRCCVTDIGVVTRMKSVPVGWKNIPCIFQVNPALIVIVSRCISGGS